MTKLQERFYEINNKRNQIRADIEANKIENMEETEKELRSLNDEMAEIEKRMKLADTIITKTIEKPEENKNMENRTFTVDDIFYRSAYLKTLMKQPLNDIEKRAYDTTTAGVIPTQTANFIVSTMEKTAPMLKEITIMNAVGNLKIATQGTRNAAAKHTENDPVNPANDTLLYVELGGYEFIKVVSISEAISTMGIDSFESWLGTMLANDLAVAIEDAIINGDGTGDPQGVKYATTWTADNSVDYGSGLLYTNITDAIGKLPAKYDPNAKFLMNKKTFWTQVANITDSEGNPIAVRDFVSGAGTTILGYKLLISDKVADDEIYLGDYKQVYGNLQKLEVRTSNESGFRSASIDFRAYCLFDCAVADSNAFIKLYT